MKGIHIKVAYEIRRGNPFAKYSPYDFSLDEPPIATLMSGCKIHQALRNQMAIEIFSPVFHCEVRGFDENRDIRVEAKPISVS